MVFPQGTFCQKFNYGLQNQDKISVERAYKMNKYDTNSVQNQIK